MRVLIVDDDPLFRLGSPRRSSAVTGSSSSFARQEMARPFSARQIYHGAPTLRSASWRRVLTICSKRVLSAAPV
jgi:hypothetical protein